MSRTAIFISLLVFTGFAAHAEERKVESVRVEQNSAQPAERGGALDQGVVEQRSVVTHETVEKRGLYDQAVGISLQAGMVNIDDGRGDGNTRAAAGLSVDGNFLAGVQTERGKPFLGPSVTFLYSHLGQPGANFLGLNAPGGDSGADFLQIPLNMKAGYTFSDVARLSVHGGVNINYLNNKVQTRDVATSTVNGETVTTISERNFRDEDWDTHPNVGADVEIGLGKSVLFLIRPDWTFRSNGGNIFTGTLGLGFPLS